MFWANKGKGKGKDAKEPSKPAEKPRSISAFFAKAPPKPADDGGDAEQPAKRARVAEASSPAAAASHEPMSIDDSPPPPPRALAPLPIPPTDAARHAHFAERLSLGVQTRNGAQRDVLVGVPFSSYGRDAGPAGPYTPLEKQVVALKRANPGILLMVEVGYKYRFFGDDATAASGVLNIFAFADRNFLVAGGPTHRGALYVRRLVEAGHKVGVVRQSETAALKAAGEGRSKLFERKLTAVYTRATIAAGVALDGGDALGDAPRVSSYLVALAEAPGSGGGSTQLAVVAVETSTGDVACGAFRDGPLRAALESHLLTLEPGEVLLVGALGAPTEKLVAGLCGGGAARVERAPSPEALLHGAALAELTELCAAERGADDAAQAEAEAHVHALMQLPELLCVALAAAAKHLASFGLARVLRRAAAFRPLDSAATMTLPPNALRQLDVLAPAGGAQGAQGSLLWLLNHARTPMGKRAVQRWVARPLRSRDAIDERLGAVAALLAADDARDASGDAASSPLAALAPALAKLPDLERCLTRALHRTATPGEFVTGLSALAEASMRLAPAADDDAEQLPADARLLCRLLGAAGDPAVAAAARALVSRLDASAAAARPPDLARLFLATADHVDPEAAGGSGDAPHHGTGFPAVDAARAQIATAEASLAEQLPGLRRELRLPRLEYVRVSEVDYLLEVPDGVPVPSGWLKHSTLKSRKLSRWHAPAVTRLVEALQRGRESLDVAARAAWDAYLASFAEAYSPLRAAADALAQLDALRALATLSRNPGYVRPTLLPDDAAPQMHVVAGRHPMLDALLDGAFVPNDTHLASDGVHCCAITGPNMGGKSVYIRQTALIALLAHVGCYVPAASASMTVCDGIFTRMGASDSLATGSSTFLEEMSEASAILRAATPRSLVILDELGRGTATVDGCAIATATLAHLASDAGPLTLFVTHFPSVARELAAALPRAVAAMHVSYSASGDAETSREAAVTFLYKLVPGVAPSSFGLNVARMAGLPPSVVAQAAIVADRTERGAQPAGAPLAPALEDALRAAVRATDAGEAAQARAAAVGGAA